MPILVKVLMVFCTITAVGGFVGAFAAHILLQFRINHDRVKEETGQPGWKIFGSLLAPIEFYKDDARAIWKIQRIGLKALAISLGVIVIVMLGAAAFTPNEKKAEQGARANDPRCHAACSSFVYVERFIRFCTRRASEVRGSSLTLAKSK